LIFHVRHTRRTKNPLTSRTLAVLASTAVLVAGAAGSAQFAYASTHNNVRPDQSVGPLNISSINTQGYNNVYLEFWIGAGNGTPLHVYQYSGTQNQDWYATDIQSGGNFELQNNETQFLCMDIPNDDKGNDIQVQGWGCNGNPQQFWQFQSVSSTEDEIQNTGTYTCLNDWNGDTSNNAPVKTYTCGSSIRNDEWQI
jgi:hypothetical protein